MNHKILVVDDETNVRLNYRVALETDGYEVVEAHSGEKALERMAAETFGLGAAAA